MEKRTLVADIHDRLVAAGYQVTRSDIGDAFPSSTQGKYCPKLMSAYNARHLWWLEKLLKDHNVPMITPKGEKIGNWAAKEAKAAQRRQQAADEKAHREEEMIFEKHFHFQSLARLARHRGRTCQGCGYHDPCGRFGISCPNCELPVHLAAAI